MMDAITLLPLCYASLARPTLPVLVATDASGGDAGGCSGFGAAVTVKPGEEVREEMRWAERRGAYQRLSPGKTERAIWKETLEATGLSIGKDKKRRVAMCCRRMKCTD